LNITLHHILIIKNQAANSTHQLVLLTIRAGLFGFTTTPVSVLVVNRVSQSPSVLTIMFPGARFGRSKGY